MDPAPSPTGFSPQAVSKARASYALRVSVSKSEVDLATTFLTKGGTLGSAAARGPTSFAVSHADTHDTFLVTEASQTIDLPLSPKLLSTSSALYEAETGGLPVVKDSVGPYVLLSDRTRLNVLSMRTGAAINGTLVSTLSGTASVPLLGLFGTSAAESAVEGAKGKVARAAMPFTQIPLQYPNWNDINATLGVCYPQVIRTNEDGSETEVSAIFFTPSKATARLASVQPILKSIYDKSWEMTKHAKFVLEPNLTKSVAFTRNKGFDASGFTLAASVNDTPAPLLPETTEAVLGAALAQELQGDHAKALKALSVPSIAATNLYAVEMATGLSAIAAWSKPYRVDGAAFNSPTGLQMVQSESWPMDGDTDPIRSAGDCDDGAGLANQILLQCATLNESGTVDMDRFPNMRALANSIGAHYVHGMTVLAANAGHADAADAKATKVAGHAIITLTPKDTFAVAMQRGARAKLNGAFVVDPSFEAAVTSARWAQLYPRALVDRMPENERPLVESYEVARKFATNNVATKLQPFAIEPTTFASATLYKHDEHDRSQRQQNFIAAKESLKSIAPNMLRTFSSLDIGETGEHAFYHKMVETSYSMRHPLFTDGPLRSMGAACCHVRHVQVSPANEVTEAGASPKDLATGNFALVPLWTTDAQQGPILDEAHAESLTNAMPMRGKPIVTDDAVFKANMETLRGIKAFFEEEGKAEYEGILHQAVVSFASLIGNEHALNDVSRVLKGDTNIRGEIFGLDEVVEGVAVNHNGEQLGRYIVMELELPA